MVGFDTIFAAVLPVFALVLVGWCMRRIGGLTPEGEQNLMRLVVNLLYPCFIYAFVLGNLQLKSPGLLLEAGLTGFLTVALGCLTCYWLAPLFRKRDQATRRTFSVAAGLHNFGYIAIPVAQIIFENNEIIGVMLVVNTGVDLAIWTVCVMVISGGFDRKALRRAFNPPVIALISAAILNFLDAELWLPGFFLTSISMLAPCAIPVGLIMIGTAFYGLTGQIGGKGTWSNALGTMTLRQGLLPLLILIAVKVLPLAPDIKNVLIIHAAMPAAVFPIVLAKFYGGDTVTAIQCIVPSALAGFITIPLWVQFGLWWVG